MDLLAAKPLDLADIRRALIRQEDTIIIELMERCQFPLNKSIYEVGAIPLPSFHGSFLDWMLERTEHDHALVRRYQSPDEYPFSENLPDPIIEGLDYPPLIRADGVNVNNKIKHFYLDDILPNLLKSEPLEKKETYGSASTCDIKCLQALSRRIHFGKFVAEVKFLSDVPKYTKMIQDRDVAGLEEGITNAAVEKQVLARLERKANKYGQELDEDIAPGSEPQFKVDVKTVVAMYEHYVIPLTKEVEIEYLLRRLDDGK